MSAGIKAVGRFINRGTDSNDGMLIGVAFKGSPLKENTVYQIIEAQGELVIREVGPSVIANHRSERWDESPVELSWVSLEEQLNISYEKELFLSREEYNESVRKDPLLARFSNPGE